MFGGGSLDWVNHICRKVPIIGVGVSCNQLVGLLIFCGKNIWAEHKFVSSLKLYIHDTFTKLLHESSLFYIITFQSFYYSSFSTDFDVMV